MHLLVFVLLVAAVAATPTVGELRALVDGARVRKAVEEQFQATADDAWFANAMAGDGIAKFVNITIECLLANAEEKARAGECTGNECDVDTKWTPRMDFDTRTRFRDQLISACTALGFMVEARPPYYEEGQSINNADDLDSLWWWPGMRIYVKWCK